MKNLFLTTIFFISALSFAQHKECLNGTLTDAESVNEPLVFAKIKVKETGKEVFSDENGLFKIEHLNEGVYTLVCSFTGYDKKEIEVEVVHGATKKIEIFLSPSTISLDDLVLTLASTDEAKSQ